MKKALLLLAVTCLVMLTGCGEKVEVVSDEIYELNSYQAQYEGIVISTKQIKYPIDPTMNVKVETNQDVTANTILYSINNPDSDAIVEKAKFEVALQNDQLKKLNDQIAKTSKEDPMYNELVNQKNTISDQIKVNEFTVKNTSGNTNTYAKFDGKVIYDFQNSTLMLSSKEKGVNLTTDYKTLQETMSNRTTIKINDRDYNLKVQSYLPVKQTNNGTETTVYNVLYSIENLDQELIESQPITVSVDQQKLYIPKKFVAMKDGAMYIKVNDEIKQIDAIDQGGRVEVISGAAVGDKITIIGAKDDFFK